jgi:hypothetical protein
MFNHSMVTKTVNRTIWWQRMPAKAVTRTLGEAFAALRKDFGEHAGDFAALRKDFGEHGEAFVAVRKQF